MDFINCKEKKLIRTIRPDLSKATSLEETAHHKQETTTLLSITPITATSIITLLYDAIRELLEAKALRKGYAIYNHECYVSFIQTILQDAQLARTFNTYRLIRNAINYSGEHILLEDAKRIIQEMNDLYSISY